ncbi:hypothetical protein DL93DRAFT_415136 [Clavulina sp. PMI_390]|nr:hypothetical protein DL93DRAFT_415136 [Clavulina sp. PMI_390]
MHVQMYTWYCRFPRDPYHIKVMITLLWIAQTFYFFSNSCMLYRALVSDVKSYANAPIWELKWIGPHKLVVTTLYQIFFTLRLWSSFGISKHSYYPLPQLLHCGFCFFLLSVNVHHVWRIPVNIQYATFWWEKSAWNGAIAVTDILLSAYLAFLMLRRRNGFKSTRTIMQLITIYGVATGGLSAILAIVTLISGQLDWLGGIYATATWAPAVMICAIMANLHLRSSLRASMPREESIPTPSFSLHVLGRASSTSSDHNALASGTSRTVSSAIPSAPQ